MKHHPYQRHKRQTYPEVGISEEGNIRSLHLGSRTVQSAMNLDNPSELVLSYSRSMMAWLLFQDSAQHITHIGLGGGSMVRWIDTYCPQITQTAVEINPQIIHIAQSLFELPFEDEHFEIIEADGAEYIKVITANTDVILTDGFDGEDIIDDLVSEDFFQNAKEALSPSGIFVTNLWGADPRYPLYIERLTQVFNKRILELPASTHGNMAVLAFNQMPKIHSLDKLRTRAQLLSTQTHLDFNEIYHNIKSYGPHNGKVLKF